jgi:hypothetical protein
MKYIARCEFGGSVFDKYVIEADDRIKAQAVLEARCEEHGLNINYFWLVEVPCE